jgi:hypothetical protein
MKVVQPLVYLMEFWLYVSWQKSFYIGGIKNIADPGDELSPGSVLIRGVVVPGLRSNGVRGLVVQGGVVGIGGVGDVGDSNSISTGLFNT